MSPDINLLPDELRRREGESKSSPSLPLMHQPSSMAETPAPSSRRSDFFKLFHRSHDEEDAEAPAKPELIAASPEPRESIVEPVFPPAPEVTPPLESDMHPPMAWHDVPEEERPEEAPTQVDLIPGVVSGINGLRVWVIAEAIGAVALLLIIVFVHLMMNRAERAVLNERLFERERIAALGNRIDEIEQSQGGANAMTTERLKALQGRVAAHRDWRILLDLFERNLFSDVVLLQLRADEGGVVVVEARTSRVDGATAQARYLQEALGKRGTVTLGDVRIVADVREPQPFVQFRLSLTLVQDFWMTP